MKITNTQSVLDFFGDEQVIQDLLQNFNQVADDDSEDDSDYEESENEESEDSDDEHEEESEDEEEEKHQFYRQQAQEWQEHQELEEAKANELFEDEWRYRERFENELRLGQLTQEQQQINNEDEEIPALVTDDSESDTEELVEEQQPIHLGPPPVLRRERESDYLTPERNIEVRTPDAPERRRVLGDITNITIRPRRLRFNN